MEKKKITDTAIIAVFILILGLAYFKAQNLSELAGEAQSISISYIELGVKDGGIPYSESKDFNEITEEQRSSIWKLMEEFSYRRKWNTLFSDNSLSNMNKLLHINISGNDEAQMITLADTNECIIRDKRYHIENAAELIDGVMEILAVNDEPQQLLTMLTENEIKWLNDIFFAGEEWCIADQFVTSEYEKPEDIELNQLFYMGKGKESSVLSYEEEQHLKTVSEAYANLDISKISRSDMDEILTKWAGMTLEETNKVGLDQMHYWAKTDSYYIAHGDINYLENFKIESGNRLDDGNIVIQYSSGWKNGEAVLKPKDNSYIFVSNKYTGYNSGENQTVDYLEKGFREEGWKFFSSVVEGESIWPWFEEKTYLDFAVLFDEYNGEKIQRISPEVYETYSPAVCPDIVFYKAEQDEKPEEAVVKMIDEMIRPLAEPSEERPFTITEYKIESQEVIPLKENVWLLPILNGYYSYEGKDLVAMNMRAEYAAGHREDGLISFLRQGSEGVFMYILLEQDGVYRLQRMGDMMEAYPKQAADRKVLAYITNYEEGAVSLDKVEWVLVPSERADELNAADKGPGGFYVYNAQEIIEKIVLSENCSCSIADGAEQKEVSLEELMRNWDEWINSKGYQNYPYYGLYHLTIEDNVITEIVEQYVP